MISIKKISFNLALSNLVLILSFPTLALCNDSQQPIYINSFKQLVDFKRNILIFTKNVNIKQGVINFKADKVIVTRMNNDPKKIVVEAYGSPTTFYQLQGDGKAIKGRSDKIRYETEKKLVTLSGNAYLEQIDSNIKSDKIIYLIQSKQIQAFSDKGKQITTILFPTQLQN